MSKNYKTILYSATNEQIKEEAFIRREEEAQKVQQAIIARQKADADRLKMLVDSIKALEALFSAIDMQSNKGTEAKAWLENKLSSAIAGGETMYKKLKDAQ